VGNKAEKSTQSQIQNEPIRKEIKGIIFLLIAIILGVSLFSFHPDDPLYWDHPGPLGGAHNLFGIVGSHLAGGIFFLFGFSSFWLVIVFFITAVLSFKGATLLSPIRSAVAILCLVVSFSGLIQLQFLDNITYRGGSVVSGGLVGLYLSRSMEGFLNYFGAYLLSTFQRIFYERERKEAKEESQKRDLKKGTHEAQTQGHYY
jgi:S-DNA-T family DNA segregation ATPase FtsK/SpoIIIE